MAALSRREALRKAAALGAALAWSPLLSASRRIEWRERRDCYPQGVASGDPHPDSVLLWTRRPPVDRPVDRLIIEVARDVDLLITDNRSFRSEPVTDRPEFAAFRDQRLPFFLPQDVVEILDAGRGYNNGLTPDTIAFNGSNVKNPRAQAAPQSMLGRTQKAWFLSRLRNSTATWKLWANSVAVSNWRTDLQNLPDDKPKWGSAGFGQLGDDNWSGYCTERDEILEFARRERIAGLVSIAGDRHAFCAGLLSTGLPPKTFAPIAVEFVVGSVSAPGLAEASTYAIGRDHPLRALYVYESMPGATAQCAMNVALMHGVRSAITLAETHSADEAVAMRNPQLAPHLWFLDCGGHGYAVVASDGSAVTTEFVCVPRPIERSSTDDGGPVTYRATHRVASWRASEAPALTQTRLEGDPPLLAVRNA